MRGEHFSPRAARDPRKLVMADRPQPIMIVSGLPRSGTSLMMQMLDRGGIEILTDRLRTPDLDNPRGYCEFEQVKKIKSDQSWLPNARGKAVKMVSQLLFDLPATEQYQVIFMERNLDEVLASQEKMLSRLNQVAGPQDQIRNAFEIHLQRFWKWVRNQPHVSILSVSYNQLMDDTRRQAERVHEFLGELGDIDGMISAVDGTLYRNRAGGGTVR
jgi:hypothetical protein